MPEAVKPAGDLQEERRRIRLLCHLSHLEDTLFTQRRGREILRSSGRYSIVRLPFGSMRLPA
jgi:hypothetical protein